MSGANIAKAVLGVMAEVAYVQKGGRVSGGGMNYSFAGEADLLQALRPAMVKHELALLPIGAVLSEHHETVETKYGPKASRTVRVVSTFRLLHSSGESIDLQVAGEGQDKGDKATAKAMTIALKYALRQAFLIETGDDPDRSRPEAPNSEFELARQECWRLIKPRFANESEANKWLLDQSEGAYTTKHIDTEPILVLRILREAP